MDYNICKNDLDANEDIIYALHKRYYTLLQQHMSLKKKDRDANWDKTRIMLFHVQGALSIAAHAFSRRL